MKYWIVKASQTPITESDTGYVWPEPSGFSSDDILFLWEPWPKEGVIAKLKGQTVVKQRLSNPISTTILSSRGLSTLASSLSISFTWQQLEEKEGKALDCLFDV